MPVFIIHFYISDGARLGPPCLKPPPGDVFYNIRRPDTQALSSSLQDKIWLCLGPSFTIVYIDYVLLISLHALIRVVSSPRKWKCGVSLTSRWISLLNILSALPLDFGVTNMPSRSFLNKKEISKCTHRLPQIKDQIKYPTQANPVQFSSSPSSP